MSCRRSSRASVSAEAATRRRMSARRPVGDHAVAGLDERAMAQPQRRGEVVDRRDRRAAGAESPAVPPCDVLELASAQRRVARSRARTSRSSARYGSCGVADAGPQLVARVCHRQLARAAHRLRAGTGRRPSSAPSRSAWRVTSGVTFGLPSRSPPIHDAEAERRGVERQAAAGVLGQRAGRAGAGTAAAPPRASARTPAARRGPRRAATAATRRTSSVCQRRQSRAAALDAVSRSRSVKSGRSRIASGPAMRRASAAACGGRSRSGAP